MATLFHDDKPIQTIRADFQTRMDGDLKQRYECYLHCADDGNGIDICTGNPLLTFNEWAAK